MTAYDYDSGTGAFDGFGSIAARILTLDQLQTDLDNERATIISTFKPAEAFRVLQALDQVETVIREAGDAKIGLALSAGRQLLGTVDDEQALSDATIAAAARRLSEFMVEDARTISESTVASSEIADPGNTGDPIMIVGFTNPDGEIWQQVRAEQLIARCIQDAQGPSSLVRPGSEVWRVRGDVAVDRTSEFWPKGSGIDVRLAQTSGTEQQSQRPNECRLANGDLEDWTSDVPDHWSLEVGVAGGDLVKDAINPWRGQAGAELIGDNVTQTRLTQLLDGNQGVRLEPRRVYAISIAVTAVVAAPLAGVLTLALRDGTNTDIVNDGGQPQTFDIDLTGIVPAGKLFASTFQTGASIPDGARLVIEVSTPISLATSVLFDEVVLQEMSHPQPAGPYIAIAAGKTDSVIRDEIISTVTNTWADATWVREFDRLFSIYDHGIWLPPAPVGNSITFRTRCGRSGNLAGSARASSASPTQPTKTSASACASTTGEMTTTTKTRRSSGMSRSR
jgi:hypothetical protein